MKSAIRQFFWGKENRLNGLTVLGVVSLVVLGCTCNLGNLLSKDNNSTTTSNTFSPLTNTRTTPANDSETPAPPVAKTPGQPPAANIRPPVEVAYIHFLDEAHRNLGGNLKVGSPKKTGTRIEVRVVANGEPETLVVLEKTNDGRKATVIVGPKDGGAVRSYTLTLGTDGWKITDIKELDG